MSSIGFEGGVWRAIYHAHPSSHALLVGVYSEFTYNMVTIDPAQLTMEETPLKYDLHQSLTYGMDIKRGSSEVGSISFYDN